MHNQIELGIEAVVETEMVLQTAQRPRDATCKRFQHALVSHAHHVIGSISII
jgi:hypothetical protein